MKFHRNYFNQFPSRRYRRRRQRCPSRPNRKRTRTRPTPWPGDRVRSAPATRPASGYLERSFKPIYEKDSSRVKKISG